MTTYQIRVQRSSSRRKYPKDYKEYLVESPNPDDALGALQKSGDYIPEKDDVIILCRPLAKKKRQ